MVSRRCQAGSRALDSVQNSYSLGEIKPVAATETASSHPKGSHSWRWQVPIVDPVFRCLRGGAPIGSNPCATSQFVNERECDGGFAPCRRRPQLVARHREPARFPSQPNCTSPRSQIRTTGANWLMGSPRMGTAMGYDRNVVATRFHYGPVPDTPDRSRRHCGPVAHSRAEVGLSSRFV